MNPFLYSIGTHICNHLDKIGFVYQAAETGSTLWQNSSPERFRQSAALRNASAVFGGCMTFISALALFQGEWKFVSRAIRIVPGLIIPMISLPALGAIALLTMTVGAGIFLLMKRNGDLSHYLPENATKSKISVKWDLPDTIEIWQEATAARMVINVALAYFSTNPYLFLINAGFAAVSFGVVSRWNWIRYTREFDGTTQNVSKVAISYFCPARPAQLCSQHQPNEKVLILQMHPYLDRLNPSVDLKPTESLNAQQGLSVSYKAEIPLSSLPACADCGERPDENVVEVHVWDTRLPPDKQKVKASVTITRPHA